MNKEEISQYIDKICQSPQFEKSTTNQTLLKFLVDSTLSHSILKEFTIAKEVFGKDASDNFNVRVYISNLRKKLDEYYLGDGSDDKIQIQIPQGQYSVEFVEPNSFTEKYPLMKFRKLSSNKWLFLFFGVVLTLIILNVFFNDNSGSSNIKNSLIWSGFLEEDKPSYIVLADHYFFIGKLSDSLSLSMRTPTINSDADLDEFVRLNPEYEKKLETQERTYLSPQSVSCLYNVLPLFVKNNTKTELRLCSTLGWSDLPNHNFLFIGSYRATGIFTEYLGKAGISFNNKTSVLDYKIGESTNQYHFGRNYLLEDDYVSVLKLRTDNGKEILFFLSSYEIGNDAVTKYFTNDALLAEFEKKIPKESSKCFKALFKVSGIYTTAFKTELLHIDQIENTELLKWP